MFGRNWRIAQEFGVVSLGFLRVPLRLPFRFSRTMLSNLRFGCVTAGSIIVMLLIQTEVFAQGYFIQLGASAGRLTRPITSNSAGGEFGIGYGKNLVSFEVAVSSWGNYALGIGTSMFPANGPSLDEEPVSGSTIREFSFLYKRDLYSPPRIRTALFGLAGFGFTRNNFSITQPCYLVGTIIGDCGYGTATTPPTVSGIRTSPFTLTFGGGFRTAVWKGLGIQGEVRASHAGPGDLPSDLGIPAQTATATLFRVSAGIYVRAPFSPRWLIR